MHDSLFLTGVGIAVAVLIARAVARRVGLPDAVAFVVLGVVAARSRAGPGTARPARGG